MPCLCVDFILPPWSVERPPPTLFAMDLELSRLTKRPTWLFIQIRFLLIFSNGFHAQVDEELLEKGLVEGARAPAGVAVEPPEAADGGPRAQWVLLLPALRSTPNNCHLLTAELAKL